LAEVATPETAYCPARPLDRISYEDILQALRAGLGQEPATREEPTRELVRGAFEEIHQSEQRVARAVTLQAMVERIEAQGRAAADAGCIVWGAESRCSGERTPQVTLCCPGI